LFYSRIAAAVDLNEELDEFVTGGLRHRFTFTYKVGMAFKTEAMIERSRPMRRVCK
jgi:hypothetical protein